MQKQNKKLQNKFQPFSNWSKKQIAGQLVVSGCWQREASWKKVTWYFSSYSFKLRKKQVILWEDLSHWIPMKRDIRQFMQKTKMALHNSRDAWIRHFPPGTNLKCLICDRVYMVDVIIQNKCIISTVKKWSRHKQYLDWDLKRIFKKKGKTIKRVLGWTKASLFRKFLMAQTFALSGFFPWVNVKFAWNGGLLCCWVDLIC